ncbi:MAG: VWA domain-containing protein [Acidobacteriota bacterium]|nr:MAG: VWA domain-containing protein [Acidobacteriota bacterium]
MKQRGRAPRAGHGAVAAGIAVGMLFGGCCLPTGNVDIRFSPADDAVYQAEVEEGIGAAVAILIDTSGSMKNSAPGDPRPKFVVAREALVRMLETTEAFVDERPDFPIKIAIFGFASQPFEVLGVRSFDKSSVLEALGRVPKPGGGTAIGEAMLAARAELYRAGVFRKYLLVVTDGECTTGRSPARVAREIHRKSEGAVQMYFVAFDTSAEQFRFLGDVNGEVIAAGDAGDLRDGLLEIYEGKILAEAVDYGESQ